MTRLMIILETTDLSEIRQIEELILLQAQLKTMDAGFQEMKIETPEWIIDRISAVSNEINLRCRSQLEKRLRVAQTRRAALRTADEKRHDLETEIAELQDRLK